MATIDDYGNDRSTSTALAAGGPVFGKIEQQNDQDWFKVSLESGTVYLFGMVGGSAEPALDSLAHPSLRLFDEQRAVQDLIIDNGRTGAAMLSYLATTSGTYYLQASSLQNSTGSYGVFVSKYSLPWDQVVDPSISPIGPDLAGRIAMPKQTDWYAFDLQAGTTYMFDLLGDGAGTGTLGAGAGEASLAVLSNSGGGLNTVDGAGVGGDPRVMYTPAASGTCYVRVRDTNNGGGTYTLKTWIGGSPSGDTLIDTPAADILDGGAGFDTMRYAGKFADYTVSKTGHALQVSGKAGAGADVLTNIERLHFVDTTLAFDANGTAGQAYRLYQAAFDRAPDSAGLGYWVKQMDGGASLASVASAFAASKEFNALYGEKPSNVALVSGFYTNVLHRPAEKAGYDYWLGVLDGGASVGDVLASFSDSAENQAALATVIGSGVAYTPYG